MAVVQNLYQIFKIPASFLVAHDCKVEDYSRKDGFKDGYIVSIGDNLVFQQLRYIHGDFRTHQEIFNKVKRYRDREHEYKKAGDFHRAHVVENLISLTLFVDDIVNVYLDGKKSDFNAFRVKGFYFNGKHYTYLCSGSGQIRRNTATFINSEYHDQIVKTLNCGLDEKTSEFCLAKYSAYFALSFSSILWVRTPRVCVVKDFYHNLPETPVDFIVKDEHGKASVEKRVMDLELNCADGQGLIDPQFAQLWGQDMELPYTPCSFVARSCFVKGNLVTFDFKEYAHTHGISTIRDKWGKEYQIDDIDVILSESQFKTHKYYNSWQEYCSYAEKGNIHWGVARYTKQYDDEFILANYQYIQALNLTPEDIHDLTQQTIKWIQQICSGELLPSLLFLFGPKDEDAEYKNLNGTAQTFVTKAIVKNSEFLKDSYVQRKIYKNIAETINKAKIGKIWLHGNYQFMIADPLAQCQAALGLPTDGLLKKDEVWSNFWRIRNVELVDLARSPMIDVHEHNPCKVVNDNEEANYWYRYITSGIIYNTFDTSCARHSDSDYDGDIVLSTDNPYFIKGSHKDHNIITYEKGLALPAKMTINNITKTVMKGFGTGVGGFSNTATILYAMAAMFDKPEDKEYHDEIMNRIKLLREIVGQEIDRIKGADKPFLPSEWKQYEEVLPTDTDDQKYKKYKHNAMVVSKKPYFFRYLYSDSNTLYKQFEAAYNTLCMDTYGGLKFKKLLKMENKTDEQRNLVRRYQKYSPLITAPCTMNRLCREFEAVDFDIMFSKGPDDKKRQAVSMLPTYENTFASSYSEEKFQIVRSMYKKYNARMAAKQLDALIQEGELIDQLQDDFDELKSDLLREDIKDLQKELINNHLSGEEFLFYCSRVSKTYAAFNWGFAWDVLDEQIISLIPFGKSYCPIRDENGTDYLGVKYSLKDISNKDELSIQKLIESMLGTNYYSMPCYVTEKDDIDVEVDQKMSEGENTYED